MSVKVTKYPKQVQAAFAKAAEVAKLGIGELMTDSLSSNTHKQTGLLRNSYNYRTSEKQGSFGNEPMENPKQELGPENQASQPGNDAVRVSSVLQYTEPYNKKFKVFEKTIDEEQSDIGGVAKAAYRKVIGT